MLTTARLLTAVLISVALTLPGPPGDVATTSTPCGIFDETTRTYVACADEVSTFPGSNADPSSEHASNDESDDVSDPQAPSDEICEWHTVEPQPLPSDEIWANYLPTGADPRDYTLKYSTCSDPGRAGEMEAVRVADAAGAAAPAVDPAVVAREAIARLPIPLPAVGIGPDRDRVAVNLPVWLWVSDPGTVTASASQGRVSVTASASLASVTWTMGEPGAAPVTCAGAGRAPWPGADLRQPPCGYTYRLRSLPDRTGGTGVWRVTAAVRWTVSWRASTGVSGTDAVTTSSTTSLDVGEWRSVIVYGG